jgi:predicted ATPase/class 3 adenylate cyclase
VEQTTLSTSEAAGAAFPSGTVAFLFADIPGNTAFWERDPAAMRPAVTRYLALLDAAIAAHGGVRYKTVDDAMQAAFPAAPAAVAAALDAQRSLAAEPWPAAAPLRVRMAIHVGEATPRDGDYLAPALNRLARLLSAGHGGQILLTVAAQALARGNLPAGSRLHDLGQHRLRDLRDAEPVFQLIHPDLPAQFPPLASLEASSHNLPTQPDLFVGRERELAEVVALLRDAAVRLLTLTGPGGSGKTRLALHAAAELGDAFPDGVFFVPLAAVTDAALVPVTIAAALGLRESAGETPREHLLASLAGKRMLLLLDNLEHLPDASPFIGELLSTAPALTVLATSRAPLRVRAEQEYPVAPLALPPEEARLPAAQLADVAAVRLFVDRSQAVKPDFALDDENAAAIAEIVRRLDGLPLAIELAAARSRLFSPPAMLVRLDKRLPLLTGGARDLPARQQALRETIAWSYDLLTPDEQALFRRLALFAGGATLEAAETVGDPTGELGALDGIARLVEHSLLQTAGDDEAGGGDAPRFTMLETIREYGLERLAQTHELAGASDRHAAYFLALAEEAAPQLTGEQQIAWLDRLETEHDNLRAALGWTIPHEGMLALRLAAALWPFWEARGHFSEGRAWLERVLANAAPAPTEVLATALSSAGSVARMQGDVVRASELLDRARQVWDALGDRGGVARTLVSLGHVADRQGDLVTAEARFEEALAIGQELGDRALIGSAQGNLGIVADERGEHALAVARYEAALTIFRELGDRRREAAALDNLGIAARSQGDLATAMRRYEEAMAIRRDVGDAWGATSTLASLGTVAHRAGDRERARHYYEGALEGFRALGDRRGIANTLGNLGIATRQEGDFPRAAGVHAEALEIAAEIGDQVGVAVGLEGVAAVAIAAGEPAGGARLLGAAEALRAALGSKIPPDDLPDYEQATAAARSQLGDAHFAETWQAGGALTSDEAIREALAVAQQIAAGASPA